MFNLSNFNTMKKKTLKAYESPKAEVIEIESQGVLCASGEGPTPTSRGIEFQSFGS